MTSIHMFNDAKIFIEEGLLQTIRGKGTTRRAAIRSNKKEGMPKWGLFYILSHSRF